MTSIIDVAAPVSLEMPASNWLFIVLISLVTFGLIFVIIIKNRKKDKNEK